MACQTAKPQPPKILHHEGCWYSSKIIDHSVQYNATTVDVIREVWEARCKEDVLERLNRQQCKIVAMTPDTVAVSDCKEGW